MKKKMVLVLDVDVNQDVDMQVLADAMSKAIGTVDEIVLHDVVLFDNDESSADKWVANLEKSPK
ncbi:hypothetical protein [Brevibacillus choshinensis]|uniref:Uncharacterized protein n=1 Tax=Brevibacillus choshinensis TaxID=54911 RepID=A0ABR5NAI9_BRECH|nr:hypothetical protein [Brevibacillus choshinensis]KQL48416.1 hypothetical protein AN963_00960 [Brevibacillus choshinensis]MED4753572.1 hypothetical protein [Brevibacillus choshinensis]MED4781996.1 hypothetical protein [Brevibacillus choshinensis]